MNDEGSVQARSSLWMVVLFLLRIEYAFTNFDMILCQILRVVGVTAFD
ncbi:hypothetical protein DFP95_106146 [Cohnella lupini]|uniref:Uncharacterized protein n=1 Tax=Cohnella lupini TaxID=1294267 RepID=A0A3D9IFC6_9BACL|nr:hypothetical protein DFP95_106146 [Cohnella lupini]